MKNSLKQAQERLKRVIESDRLNFTSETSEIIVKDLSLVLKDYFAFSEPPVLTVIPNGFDYEVSVSVKASAIKSVCPVGK